MTKKITNWRDNVVYVLKIQKQENGGSVRRLVADKLGLAPNSFDRYLRETTSSDYREPKFGSVVRLSLLLGISIDDLIMKPKKFRKKWTAKELSGLLVT